MNWLSFFSMRQGRVSTYKVKLWILAQVESGGMNDEFVEIDIVIEILGSEGRCVLDVSDVKVEVSCF